MLMKLLAIAILLAILQAHPALSQSESADRLWGLYKEGRFEDVVREGKVELTTGTPTAQVNLAVGRALVDLEKYGEGLPYLEQAVRGDPARTWVYAWAQCYLGIGQYRLGNFDEARAALINARDCAATVNATRYAVNNLRILGLAESYDDWSTFSTKHFVFHYSANLADFDGVNFARRHEEAFEKISAWFEGAPTAPIRFFVWKGKDEALVAGMPPLGFARPELNLVHARAEQTVGHEMTHVISHHAMHPEYVTGLINEGISVYHDQTGRDQMILAREALANAPELSIEVELAALWEDWSLMPADVSYPVGGAWVKVLIDKGGKEKFLEFFKDQRLTSAREVYGSDLQDWMNEFTAALYR
jgi:tetratricopeptide (TPR) repeat protein